ncbi:RNA polymerase I-specific transcription initiation factor RRN6-like protein [Metarhizium album ARSEF 1941]|uniref:RNA polymerase I-specific transcription initiation factor RRN6-like protein n=1 Tax=Metarhizium album (strain ARSEF 1941) TaxID=1081103 RepID=A0A0B2WVY7_METAS|nr:RNA polymerase I-specific transcription initiation factor RRN6-like protein [Metarhizium album ARSEF 1941]KHN98218.1 RNA polymerase I-specific transcription initiation factor RRN6-like protein [Metarhizium album ARSEF 1941]
MAPTFGIVGSLAELYPPSKQTVPESSASFWKARKVQQRWLLNSHPEAFLGGATDLEDLLKENMDRFEKSGDGDTGGPLLAVGEMSDRRQPSGIKGVPVLAVATGKSGSQLRLTRMEKSQWRWEEGKDATLNLSVIDFTHQEEESIWTGDGLPITKIKFATSYWQSGPARWLLVQSQTSVTVLRPEYHPSPLPDSSRSGPPSQPPSYITPNPLITLHHHQTGGNTFSDVCFDPTPSGSLPQIAVIDECGYWSVWRLQGAWQVAKKTVRLSLYKCGHICEGVVGTVPRVPGFPAQRHGMLQIGQPDEEGLPNVTSKRALSHSQRVLVWNSERISLLDVEADSVPTYSYVLSSQSRAKSGLILDIQSSPSNENHAFVLTTHQVIWLDLLPEAVEPGTIARPKALLACSHIGLWNEGCNMSVCSVSENQTDGSMVLVFSPSTDQLTVYWFNFSSETELPQWHRHTTSLSERGKAPSLSKAQTIRVQPAKLDLSAVGDESGPGTKYARAGIKFYQVTILDEDLAVRYCICATSIDPSLEVSLPTSRIGWSKSENRRRWKRRRKRLLSHMGDIFVLPDGMTDKDLDSLLKQQRSRPGDENTSDEVVVSKARPVLLKLDPLAQKITSQLQATISQGVRGLPTHLVDAIRRVTERGVEEGSFPLTSWMEIVSTLEQPINYGDPNEGMEAEIEGLLDNADEHVAVTQLRRRHADDPPGSLLSYPFFIKELSELWLAPVADSLPKDKQGVREIWVTEIAKDMFLSSYGVTVQNVALFGPRGSEAAEKSRINLFQARSSSQLPCSSQAMAPSSQVSASADDAPDAAFQRLKLLAPTIKQGALGSLRPPKILSYWPTERGVATEDYVSSIVLATEEKLSLAKRRLQRIETKRRAQSEKFKRPAFMRQGFPASDGLGEDSSTMGMRPPPVQAMSSQQRIPDSSPSIGIMGPSVTMSQPVSGVFGDRKRVKKGKRRSGFR